MFLMIVFYVRYECLGFFFRVSFRVNVSFASILLLTCEFWVLLRRVLLHFNDHLIGGLVVHDGEGYLHRWIRDNVGLARTPVMVEIHFFLSAAPFCCSVYLQENSR